MKYRLLNDQFYDKIEIFDVALSFAGEDREFVGKIANMLDKRGFFVF